MNTQQAKATASSATPRTEADKQLSEAEAANCVALAEKWQAALQEATRLRGELDGSYRDFLQSLGLRREVAEPYYDTYPSDSDEAKSWYREIAGMPSGRLFETAPGDIAPRLQARLDALIALASRVKAEPPAFKPEIEHALAAWEGAFQFQISLEDRVRALDLEEPDDDNGPRLLDWQQKRHAAHVRYQDSVKWAIAAQKTLQGQINQTLQARGKNPSKVQLPLLPGGVRQLLRLTPGMLNDEPLAPQRYFSPGISQAPRGVRAMLKR